MTTDFGPGEPGQPAPAKPRPWTRILAATVLVCEALVLFFVTLVASRLSDLSATTVWTAGGLGSLFCLLAAGGVRSPRGRWVGSLAQVVVLAAGIWVPSALVVGVPFALLWVAALWFGPRWEAATPLSPTNGSTPSAGAPPR